MRRWAMSNRSGDLYRCSDPDCGCEVEVRRPSEAVGASSSATQGGSGPRTMEIHDGLEKADSHMDMAYIRADEAHLPPAGSGNGLEGSRTSGGKRRAGESDPRASASGRESMRCFCGAEMRDTGTTVRSARVA